MIIYKKGNYSEPLRTKRLMRHARMYAADFFVLKVVRIEPSPHI